MEEPVSEELVRRLALGAITADPADAPALMRTLFQAVRFGGKNAALVAHDEFNQANLRNPLDNIRRRALVALQRLTQPEAAAPVPPAWRLPALPSFPLYGLTSAWHGQRRLNVWNVGDGGRTKDTINPAAFDSVDLNHGDTPDGLWGSSRVVVRNLHPQVLSSTGPIAERYPGELASGVALHSLLMLDSAAHVMAPDEVDRHSWWTRRVQRQDMQSRNLNAPPWTTATVMVDGAPESFIVQFLDDAWGASAVLKDVRLAVAGADFPLADLSLEQVDIADYYGDTSP